MPSRIALVIGSLAFATASTGVGLGAAHASSGTTTTLHLSAKLDGSQKLSTGHYVNTGNLTNRKLASSGKPAGYVTYACTLVSASDYHCNAAFTLAGGILLTRETLNFAKPTTKGVITGGDGKFAGVRGTVKEETEDTGVTVIDLTFSKK